MVTIRSSKPVKITLSDSLGTSNYTRTCEYKHVWQPDSKVKGIWLTLPNGSKFRKATAISRNKSEIVFKSGQISTGVSNLKPASVSSSDGGYRPDLVLARSSAFKGGTGIVPWQGSPANIPSPMRNEAVTKALLKISDEKAGIGEDLATYRQTLGLVLNPSMMLVNSLRNVRNIKQFQKYLQMSGRELLRRNSAGEIAAGLYLQYVYGWIPLLKDINGVMTFLKEKGSTQDFLIHGKGSSAQQAQIQQYRELDVSYNADTIMGPLDEEAVVRCKLWARIDPQHAGLRALNQLGLANPLSLMWELVPYSFVIDWMLPIGSTLKALTAPAGLLFVDGSVSARSKIKGPYQHWYTGYAPYKAHIPASGTFEVDAYLRETLPAWPTPGFYMNYSPFAGPKNDRPLKAVALAILGLRNIR